jgi:threonyl-tRNA synthetase
MIEHFAGSFPLWLAPKQVRILPVSENFMAYADGVFAELKKAGLRVELDDSSDGLGKKIRNAETDHVNYALVVGEKEVTDKTVSVRSHKTKEQTVMPVAEFVKMAVAEANGRQL